MELVTVILSALSLVGTGLQFWLKLQIKADMLTMEKSILRAIEEKYATQQVVELKFAEHERRLSVVEGKRWT
jgi:plasmid maintenance system antidote protein VapI